jgi:hypothetical protein
MPAGYKILLDVPSREPALGFKEIAGALAGFVRDSDPRFAVGIFGGWGSGKTTLMGQIRNQLPHDRCVPVDFTAWRYEKEPHLIVPLLDTVRDAVMAWARTHQGERELARRTAGVIGKATRAIVAGFSVQVGISGAVKASYDANKAIAEYRAGSESARVPQSFYHGSFVALRKAFESFVGEGTDRRIVVFVDDLDRCLPESALEVLESMKLFFDLPGFVFVVGLDQSIVEHVIDMKYAPSTVRENGSATGGARTETLDIASTRVTGADYIKKIFQVPYTLAPVAKTELREFLDSVFQEAGLSDAQRNEIETVVRPHLEYVTETGAINPREVKRYINAFTLSRQVDRDVDPHPLLALQTISFRQDWRPARQAIYAYRDVFIDALQRQVGAGGGTALEDLDPDLVDVPEAFLNYVSTPPGSALLHAAPIDRYLYAGEAVRSTQGARVLDVIRDFAGVRQRLRDLRTSVPDRTTRAHEALRDLKPMESVVPSIFARSATAELIRGDIQRATAALERFADPEENRSPEQWQELLDDVDNRVRRNIKRLVDLYLAGDVGAQA